MPKQEKAEAPETKVEDKPKRRNLTPAERVAKLEAELAATKAKAEAERNKKRDVALEKRAKLVTKRDELTKQIEAIDEEFPATEPGDSSAEIAETGTTNEGVDA